MKVSPFTMAMLYFFVGCLLVFFAISNVRVVGWSIWSILIVSIAAVDYMIAARFYKMHRAVKDKEQK